MKRSLLVLSLVAVMLAAAVVPSGALVTGDGGATTSARGHALVRLVGDPVATAAKTRPAAGKKINFSSTTVKSYRAQLTARRNDFKRWLQANAPKANVTAQFDTTLNAVAVALNGTSLETLRSAPQAAQVAYQSTFRKAAAGDPDLDIINAPEGWAAAGSQGDGIKIGIVDSGIAQYHPCFDDTGYADSAELGDTRFTNDKVIAARVFSNKARNRGYTPEAVDTHGTHVAGIAACNPDTPAMIDGVLIPHTRSGVAPRALLGNYNVFPGSEASARSEDIIQALEAAAQDGMDVVNMSLGGPFEGVQDLSTMAVDNLDRMGVVVAVAAGNEGPGHYTVGSPGSAARALTAGSSQVGHGFVQEITVAGKDYVAVSGDFGEPTPGFSGPLKVVSAPITEVSPLGLGLACSTIGADLTGTIPLISRGTCDFTVKVRNVQDAGAKGVVVANRLPDEPPFEMSHNGTEPKPTIPAYMVSLEDGRELMTKDGATTVFQTQGEYQTYPHLTNRMADSSSQGPTDVDYRVKPDLVAPGDDVLSSYPGTDCGALGCWAIIGGTSMASPHLAGAAAVVQAAEPTWTAAEVRSAITNTANATVLKTTKGDPLTDPQIEGAGLLDLPEAVEAVAGLSPVSTSFGAVPRGASSLSRTVTITNLSGTGETFTLSAGAPFTVSGTPFTLASGDSRNVAVGYVRPAGAPLGDVSDYVTVTTASDGAVAHAVLYAFLK